MLPSLQHQMRIDDNTSILVFVQSPSKLLRLYEGCKQNSAPPDNLMLAITRATTTPTIEILLEIRKLRGCIRH